MNRDPRTLPPLYAVQYGANAPIFERKGDGSPVSLTDALAACYGVRDARIYRINADGTVSLIVFDAGSATAIIHRPTDRVIVRRPALTLRRPCWTRLRLVAAA